MVGDGFPDGVVAKNCLNTYLIEVKDGDKPPSARKLTPDEARFHSEWQGVVYIIGSVEDIDRIFPVA